MERGETVSDDGSSESVGREPDSVGIAVHEVDPDAEHAPGDVEPTEDIINDGVHDGTIEDYLPIRTFGGRWSEGIGIVPRWGPSNCMGIVVFVFPSAFFFPMEGLW